MLTQINVPYKDFIEDKILAKQIKNMEKRTEDDRMEVLFTELDNKELYMWMIQNDISVENMRRYYEKYILPLGLRNYKLEEILNMCDFV